MIIIRLQNIKLNPNNHFKIKRIIINDNLFKLNNLPQLILFWGRNRTKVWSGNLNHELSCVVSCCGLFWQQNQLPTS